MPCSPSQEQTHPKEAKNRHMGDLGRGREQKISYPHPSITPWQYN